LFLHHADVLKNSLSNIAIDRFVADGLWFPFSSRVISSGLLGPRPGDQAKETPAKDRYLSVNGT